MLNCIIIFILITTLFLNYIDWGVNYLRKIAVIGSGYVGLVTAIGLADFGNIIECVDIDSNKIEELNKGIAPFYEPGLQDYLMKNIKAKRIQFSTNINEAIKNSEIVFICVGTPSKANGEVDLSQVEDVVNAIVENLNGYKVIVTKSTVIVGTNRWIKSFITEKSKKDSFDVISNPEFLREGKAVQDFFHPDRIVIGYDSEKAKEMIKEIYRPLYLIETPFVFCNFETAELIKYASNAFLATKITFINQIANLCEAVGADITQVAKGMGMDGRIGSKFLHPGPGYGGSCFPKDTKGLLETGKKNNVDLSLVREVINANESQKIRMVDKLKKLIGEDIKGKVIAILGLAFKAETDDIRESPGIVIIEKLLNEGAIVKVHDPKAMDQMKKIYPENIIYYYDSEYDAVKDAEILMILTEWNQYRNIDLNTLKNIMRGNIILDCRNVLDPATVKSFGFNYEGVGR